MEPEEIDLSEYYVYPNQMKKQRMPTKGLFNIGTVTKWLIIICIAVYILLPSDYYPLFMYNSDYVAQMPWTLITNAFLHADFFHLLFNCFSLFLFGSILELRHGSKTIIVIFFSSVILANLAFGFFSPGIYGLGISGFVYALIGAAVLLEPQARVIFPIGFFFTTAPVIIAGPLLFLFEVIYSIISSDGIGHVAHAAGFLVGLGIAYINKKELIRF